MASNVHINHAAIEKLRKDIASRLSDVKIPLGGSESSAIADVERQLRAQGVTPDHAAVRKLVLDARQRKSK
jgi:hypothetical protein